VRLAVHDQGQGGSSTGATAARSEDDSTHAPWARPGPMVMRQTRSHGRSPRQPTANIHGLTTVTPQFSKSLTFRVANLAPA